MNGTIACLEVEFAERIGIVRTFAILLLLAGVSFAVTATGGVITQVVENGTYYNIHTFTTNGTFNVSGGTLNVSVLVVGGGGGGRSGGGGAGGLWYNASYQATGVTQVLVGKGGFGAVVDLATASCAGSGGNSNFGGTSPLGNSNMTGGGGGGNTGNSGAGNGCDGGSGGGGGSYATGTTTGGGGVQYTGNNGGTNGGQVAPPYPTGGGGGAGAVGQNAHDTTFSGNGGSGLNYSINGTNMNYSCGGGGGVYAAGTGGIGGCASAGNGSGSGNGGSAIGNTGSGGGGAASGFAGGNGADGIVIVRYPATAITPGAPLNLTFTAPATNNTQRYLNTTFGLSFIPVGTVGNCTLYLNNTAYGMNMLTNSTCEYNLTNAVGNYTYYARACDTFSNCTNSNSFYTTSFNYSSTLTYLNPEGDLQPDNLKLNITSLNNLILANLSTEITAVLMYNGVSYFPATQIIGGLPFFNYTVQPPAQAEGASSVVPFNWTINFDALNVTDVIRKNTSVYFAGLINCGGLSNNSSVNILIRDEQTNASVLAAVSVYTTYNISTTKTSSFSNSSTSNWTICISPDSLNIGTTNTISIANSSYAPRTIIDTFNISSNLTTHTYYLLNTSAAYPTNLKIVQNPNLPMSNIIISVYSFTAPSTYTLLQSCTTDASGVCIVYLIPNTKQYIYNFTALGVVQSFGPEVLSCAASTCYRTFTIGSAGSIPLDFTGQLSGSCAYINSTGVVTCSGSDASHTLTSLHLQAYQIGNTSLACNSTVASYTGTLMCVLPITCGTYSVIFYGTDINGVPYTLSGANVGAPCASSFYGRNGWMAALMLFLVLALIAYYNIALSMVFGSLALVLGMFIGIIPIDANTTSIIIIAIFGAVIAYRAKV